MVVDVGLQEKKDINKDFIWRENFLNLEISHREPKRKQDILPLMIGVLVLQFSQ